MDNTTQNLGQAFHESFKAVLNLYMTYVDGIEKVIEKTDPEDKERLKVLDGLLAEVVAGLEHDMAVYQRAAEEGNEELKGMDDQLKIKAIQDSLKQ